MNRQDPVATIYHYGWIAWVWRVLAVFGLAATALLLFLALRFNEWAFVAIAAPLAVPSVFFPGVLAVRIDRASKEEIIVTNLFFIRRRIRRESLGRPRVRLTAQSTVDRIDAPRAWIPVERRWPIYVDLWAGIPDPTAFRSALGLPRTPAR